MVKLSELGLNGWTGSDEGNVKAIAVAHGIVVSFQPFKPETSGVLVKEPDGRIVIGVNSAHLHTRQRFTIAHKLGHYALEHPGEIFVD